MQLSILSLADHRLSCHAVYLISIYIPSASTSDHSEDYVYSEAEGNGKGGVIAGLTLQTLRRLHLDTPQ